MFSPTRSQWDQIPQCFQRAKKKSLKCVSVIAASLLPLCDTRCTQTLSLPRMTHWQGHLGLWSATSERIRKEKGVSVGWRWQLWSPTRRNIKVLKGGWKREIKRRCSEEWEWGREGERKRRMLTVNLRQEYGQENVLSTLTQVPIKKKALSSLLCEFNVCVWGESMRRGTTCSWLLCVLGLMFQEYLCENG